MTNTEAEIETGLLETILAEPWDEENRLVYADWLEEHSNSKAAELLRLQIDLSYCDAEDRLDRERRLIEIADDCDSIPAITITNSIGTEFVLVYPGAFLMGSPESELDRWKDEGPQHPVLVDRPFLIGRYPVTQAEWEAVMGNNPSSFLGERRPVERVSWTEAQQFVVKLNERQDGLVYRLPTEAEWEYCCRAGTTTRWSCGDDLSRLSDYAVFDAFETASVGSKRPNPWGLFDMHGNVWEWCQDSYGPYDINVDASLPYRVIRGGSWPYLSQYCRSAIRSRYTGGRLSTLGFRLAAEPVDEGESPDHVVRGGSWKFDSHHCRSALRIWSTPDFRNNILGFRIVAEPAAEGGQNE